MIRLLLVVCVVLHFCPVSFGKTTAEALKDSVAERMLLYQRVNGGWPQPGGDPIKYENRLSKQVEDKLVADRGKLDATIDDGATTREINHLMAAYTKTKNAAYFRAAERGILYLLSAQNSAGGWPQFYPDSSSYHPLITYNDGAMVAVLWVMEHTANGTNGFGGVNKMLVVRAKEAVSRGVRCILKTQYRQQGKLTAWCAQHDQHTLLPAKARMFELPSLSGNETVGIIRFLMHLNAPSAEVKQAVSAAVAWLESVKLSGIALKDINDPTQPKGKDRVVVSDPNSTLWARFYDLDTNVPFFSGRDSARKKTMAEIENERRTGYAWYGNWPAQLLKKDYPNWLKKWGLDQRMTVAQDGSGDFTTVQAALNAIPFNNQTPVVVQIRKGVYTEKLTLDSTKQFVTLIGEDKATTILTYNDFSGKVTAPDGRTLTTSTSGSFYIFGHNFRAENLTFQNTAGPVGQAVAAFVTGDRMVFVNCRFLGFQDTLYTGSPRQWGRQYYKDCYIEGTTDFIFGSATAVFDHCTVFSKAGGHYVTAASTPEGKAFGYVFRDCVLTNVPPAERVGSQMPPANGAPANDVYLGRPWRPFAKTVFINATLGAHIKPEGWHNWSKPDAEKTTLYAESNSTGPGAMAQNRVVWSKQLTADETRNYNLPTIFGDWNPNPTSGRVNGLTGVRDTSFTVGGTYRKLKPQYSAIQIVGSELPANVKAALNVVYCRRNGRDLHLDAFYPAKSVGKKLRPAVLLIHGGGWRSGERSQQVPMAQGLAEKGYVAVTVEYRLSTEALYPAAVHDLKAAVRWLRANAQTYAIDTNRIAALGCSAGGQLAALLGATGDLSMLEGVSDCAKGHSSAVQAVVDVDGLVAFDHPESGEGDDRKSTSAATYWFGGPKTETLAQWHEASPLTYANRQTAPILFLNSSVVRMHAGRDDLINQLKARGIHTEVYTFADAPHPFWLFHPWFTPTMTHTLKFLDLVFGVKR